MQYLGGLLGLAVAVFVTRLAWDASGPITTRAGHGVEHLVSRAGHGIQKLRDRLAWEDDDKAAVKVAA
jgi:hypothetical protein